QLDRVLPLAIRLRGPEDASHLVIDLNPHVGQRKTLMGENGASDHSRLDPLARRVHRGAEPVSLGSSRLELLHSLLRLLPRPHRLAPSLVRHAALPIRFVSFLSGNVALVF